MRDRVLQVVVFLGIVAGAAGSSQGGLVTFQGADVGAGPTSPQPMSNAAAANFYSAASALGPLSTITFENAPLGAFSSLVVAPGVIMTGRSQSGGDQSINNTPNDTVHPQNDDFNTTSGGSQYVEVGGGTLTLNFTTPTQFFGVYLTGVQTSLAHEANSVYGPITSIT
jgi:hypothetical protein